MFMFSAAGAIPMPMCIFSIYKAVLKLINLIL